jgi:hypothetical protein
MTINSIFKDMLFAHGFGLDMKREGKRSIGRSGKEGEGIREIARSQQGACRSNRKSIRLPGYDYSRAGAYFVTMNLYFLAGQDS